MTDAHAILYRGGTRAHERWCEIRRPDFPGRITAVVMLLTAFGTLLRAPGTARAQDRAPSNQPYPSQAAIVAEFRRTLRTQDDRLVVLARQALDPLESLQRSMDQAVDLRISVSAADAEYLNAQLDRKVAEVEAKSLESEFVAERATIEGDLSLARGDLMRKRDIAEFANERADAKTRRKASRDELEAALAVERLESKKRIFLERVEPMRVKEFESRVASARSREAEKRAGWVALKNRLKGDEQAVSAARANPGVEPRILALIHRAVPIRERAHTQLDRLAKGGNSDEALQKEIRDRTNALSTLLDEAEAIRAANDFAALRPRIQEAARRYGVDSSR